MRTAVFTEDELVLEHLYAVEQKRQAQMKGHEAFDIGFWDGYAKGIAKLQERLEEVVDA